MSKEVPTAKPRSFSSRKPLYEINEQPGLVFRYYDQWYGREEEDVQDFTNELFKLESYGIHFPGLSTIKARIQNPNSGVGIHNNVKKLLGTELVNGKSLGTQLREVPEVVASGAFEAVLNYYEDKAEHGGVYISDLHPKQLVYGSTSSDTSNCLYFIDMDPFVEWTEIEKNRDGYYHFQPWTRYDILNSALPEFLIQMQTTYDNDFDQLKKRLAKLASTQHISMWDRHRIFES